MEEADQKLFFMSKSFFFDDSIGPPVTEYQSCCDIEL